MIEIDHDLAEQRLDNFLMKTLKGLPKSRLYRIIRKGEVRISGKRARPDDRLKVGDVVRVPPVAHLPERNTSVGSFRDLESLKLYEDDRLLVINKPAGMAVHGGSGVSAGVIESLRHALPEGKRLELVHRLDRGTSGCLMVAKKRSYLRLLQDALRQPGQIRKSYLALVHGLWPDDLNRIDQPLLTTTRQGNERVTRVNEQGKPAITEFTLLAHARSRGAELSLVRASPLTGRTHQIRVHARWARHPLAGDDRYGDKQLDLDARLGGGLMLHAAELSIPSLDGHPAIRVKAPLSSEFQREVDAIFPTISIYKQ